ncbi:MAG: NAD(+)/NADH kinase [Candidatus Lokiarchaeota archaeon]|nr:NAD(+)/NADH kinase [Candidatus Lokiarchaeota archaeon]
MQQKPIIIACRMDSERALNLARNLYNYLNKEKGREVLLETRIAPKIMAHCSMDLEEMKANNVDFIIVIGGDGSVLRVVKGLYQRDPPPIFGANIGSIGFLDETYETRIYKDLDKVLNGKFLIEKVSKITPYIVKSNSEELKLSNALNEILIISSKFSKVLQISIKINGVFLNRSYLDGVIISTSTGSTAYNLSAGGAIVYPSLNIMQITELNAYARTGLKPIIVPIDSEVEIKLLRPRLNGKIVIDGQTTIKEIQPNTKIRIRKANSYAKFIRLSKSLSLNYFKRLRKKIIGNIRIPMGDSPEE